MYAEVTAPLWYEDLELGGHWAMLRCEATVSHSGWRAFVACALGNRHQPAPLLACTLELA
jgi:hypothetical protein